MYSASASPQGSDLWLQDASPPEGELASAVDRDLGGLQKLQTKLSGMCAADQLQVSPAERPTAETTHLGQV